MITLSFVQYRRMYATMRPLLTMPCTDRGTMVQAQQCSEWSVLQYSMLV